MIRSLLLCCLLAGLSLPASAADVEAVSRSKDWSVFRSSDGGQTVCYAATLATDKAPKSAQHGEVAFYVSAWRGERGPAQPSLKVGYEFRTDIPAKAIVGRSNWKLYTADNEAFAHDDDEAAIISALRRGSTLRVEATSKNNSVVAYEFSLSGSAAAIDQAMTLCR